MYIFVNPLSTIIVDQLLIEAQQRYIEFKKSLDKDRENKIMVEKERKGKIREGTFFKKYDVGK